MKWFWRVRIYNKEGHYWIAQIATERNLQEIDGIQDFYANLTGCKLLLEGMSEQEHEGVSNIQDAFDGLWLPPRNAGASDDVRRAAGSRRTRPADWAWAVV